MAKLKKLHGSEAAAAYVPSEGDVVAVYTHKFKPEHYRKGVDIVTGGFPGAALKAKQHRHFIFLRRPVTHELVNITFFHTGADAGEWHESASRRQIVEKLQPMLDAPIDVQIYEVAGCVGVGSGHPQ